jgi:ferredoxin-type protein NapF
MNKVYDEKRRRFLGGRQLEIRPPWALGGDQFFKICTCCRHCLEACPQGILSVDRFGYPLVDFSTGECIFCGQCVESCPEGALLNLGQKPWHHKPFVAESCLSKKGTLCRTCGEACETGAISYPMQDKGFSQPVFDLNRCTGCGACLRSCPVQAITMTMP